MMPADLTQAQKSEQAGAAIGLAALDQVLNAPDQSEAILAIQNAILDLFELPRRDRAVAGFAVVVTNLIEQGLGRGL
jgi:hypothetical protein